MLIATFLCFMHFRICKIYFRNMKNVNQSIFVVNPYNFSVISVLYNELNREMSILDK